MTDLLSAAPVSAKLRALASSTAPLQMYAQALLSQPIVSLDGVPNLAADLGAAHAVGQSCLEIVTPQARKVGADALGFANEIIAFYPTLTQEAEAIDAGGPEAAAASRSFASGLRLLTAKIGSLAPDLSTLGAQAATLAKDATDVATALAADAEAAAGDQDISELQAQIATTMAAINADCQTIATGLKGAIKGLVKLAIAEYNAEDAPVEAVKAFVGTILSTAKQSEEVSAAEADALRQIDQLGKLYGELNSMLFAVAVIQTASTSASLYAGTASAAKSEALGAAAAWTALGKGFEKLAEGLDAGEPPASPLVPMLAADLEGWQTLASAAENLQGLGLLPVTVVNWTGAGALQP
jgi:hypothetical protein